MEIIKVPFEVISMITSYLGIDDVFRFSCSSLHFRYLVQDDTLCRTFMQDAAFSLEYEEASVNGDYARAMRRHVKRRAAVKTAHPFLAAVVTAASDFIFTNNVLCYTTNTSMLRLLELKGTVVDEEQANVRDLIRFTSGSDSSLPEKFTFKPLHYSCGIITSLYQYLVEGKTKSSLILWDMSRNKSRPMSFSLSSTKGLFVRNNHRHLYVGVLFSSGSDEDEYWSIQGFDMWTLTPAKTAVVLPDFHGTAIGMDACFEIFDEYFYAVSSRPNLNANAEKWNSFYHAIRFKIGDHSIAQVYPKRLSWRKHYKEGPDDDRWKLLKMAKDDMSGNIVAFESRGDIFPSVGHTQRSTYRLELNFPDFASALSTVRQSRKITDMRENDLDVKWNSAAHVEIRSPDNVHVGDCVSDDSSFTLINTPVRSYNSSCSAFVDMVNDPSSCSPLTKRLRIRTRHRGAFIKPSNGGIQNSQDAPHTSMLHPDAYGPCDSGVSSNGKAYLWPPGQSTTQPNPIVDKCYRILNPGLSTDGVSMAGDERTIIYAPQHPDERGLRPITVISFDPALRLPGLPKIHTLQEQSLSGTSLVPEHIPLAKKEHRRSIGWHRISPAYLQLVDTDKLLQGVDLTR